MWCVQLHKGTQIGDTLCRAVKVIRILPGLADKREVSNNRTYGVYAALIIKK